MTEHSPTPWKIEGFGSKSIFDANDRYVSNIDNVDFIVTAVNAYEANQALIKQLVEALGALRVQALQSDVNSTSNEWGMEALDKAFSAIAAARKAGF